MKPSFKVDSLAFGVGFALFVVSLLIRLYGIDWGLPNQDRHHSYHPDEEIVLIYSQAVEPAKFNFTPGFYNYGTFYLTMNRVASDVIQAYGGGIQKEDGSDRPEAVGRLIRAGRNLSALAGAGLAWVGFLLLYRRTHLLGAIASGLALAVAPALVIHSRFMTVDLLATFFAAVSILWATKLVAVEGEEGEPAWLKVASLSGLFAGLSAGTKYTGILALGVFVVIAALTIKDRSLLAKAAGAAVGVGLLTFFLTTPGMLLESDKFWTDFRYEMTHTSTGHGLVFAGTAPGWVLQFSQLMTGMGILTVLMGLFGLGWGARQKVAWLIGPLVFLVVVYVLIGRAEVKFLRYTFPMMPVVAMGFGWLVGECHRGGTKWGRAVVAFAILALGGLGGGLVNVVTASGWMAGEDPRMAMARTIRERGLNTVGLASDPWYYSPTLYPEINGGPYLGPQYRFEAMAATSDPRVLRFLPADINERFDFDSRLLEEFQPEAVVFSSFEMEGVQRMLESGNVPEEFRLQVDRYKAFLDRLRADYEIAAVAGADLTDVGGGRMEPAIHPYQKVHDLMYVRPILYLWERKTDSATTSSGTSTTSEPSAEPANTP